MNKDTNHTPHQPSAKSLQLIVILAHLLGVILIFFLPEVLMNRSMSAHGGAPWTTYIKSLSMVVLFYVNYYIIIDYCLARRNWVGRILLFNLILIAAFLLIGSLLHDLDLNPGPGPGPERDPAALTDHMAIYMRHLSFLLRDITMALLTVALSVAIRLSQRWINLRDRQRQLESARQAQELRSLKSQLNPHFLFNTLNTLYALIDASPDKARDALHRLSSLLRYVLYESSTDVPLRSEMRFIENYVNLMRLRLDPSVELNVSIDTDQCADTLIAPLILISPIENAFKHANTSESNAHIDIAVKAQDGTLQAVIINSFNPQAPLPSSADSGIGIENLRRRLQLIYPGRAEMKTEAIGSTYRFNLSINLNPNLNNNPKA